MSLALADRSRRIPFVSLSLSLVFLFSTAIAASAAGLYTKQEITSAPQDVASMTTEAWFDGEKARIEIHSSGNPMMAAGSYIVTEDGGKTLRLVNPKEKTWAELDLEAMAQFAGSMMQSLGGMVNFEFSDPKVVPLADEAGEEMLGMKTRYVKQRVEYDLTVKVIGIKQRQSTETITEVWLVEAPSEHSLGAWYRNEPPKTGIEQLDRLIEVESELTDGMIPVRRKETSINKKVNKRGVVKDQQQSTVDMRITDWKSVDTSGVDFTVPSDYQQTTLVIPTAGEDGEGGNPLKGLFKRNG